MLLAPTRVVAREMVEALKGNEVYPTIVLSNHKETGEHPGITVMCHATWLHSVMENPNKASRPDLIVLDEAGVQQAETIALMKMYRGMAGSGGPSFLEMTATGTTCDTGSRFPIDEIGTENPMHVIRDYDFTGKKVLVFTPMISDVSGEAIVDALLRSWDPEVEVRVVRLNRKTYENVIDDVVKMKTGIVLATNIAETGLNAGFDVVIDTQVQKYPRITEKGVEMHKGTINTCYFN